MKRIVPLIAVMMFLFACHKQESKPTATEIQATFFSNVTFGDDKVTVLKKLYAQGFNDAASQKQDTHFDSIPAVDGNSFIELKILTPADTAGFDFQGLKWNDMQIQLDSKGLFSLTFHSRPTGKAEVERQCQKLLQTLQNKGYDMARTIVGQSSIEGQPSDIVGYRYTDGCHIIQFYQNDTGDGISFISLSYTES